ncbi:hypothetical protein CYD30_12650 [Kosakonia cowanii]|nr:hypothetical protein CYD30_12650 [Kosakonia cowanii]
MDHRETPATVRSAASYTGEQTISGRKTMLKVTRQAEIAIDILVLCARPRNNGRLTTRMAAEQTGTTKNHAAQIVNRLTRLGYLESERGRKGGIKLARPAGLINIGSVLMSFMPSYGKETSDVRSSRSGQAFDAVMRVARASFRSTFDGFTVADLADDAPLDGLACFDCDLRTVARHARTLSRLGDRLNHAPLDAMPVGQLCPLLLGNEPGRLTL